MIGITRNYISSFYSGLGVKMFNKCLIYLYSGDISVFFGNHFNRDKQELYL